MDTPGTAVEQYFNQLVHMRLLTQIVVSDKQGYTILACMGPPASTMHDADGAGDANGGSGSGDGQEEDPPMESNVTLSGARCFQNLEQLQLGTPVYITAQYHDAVVVQVLEPSACILTLVGSRAKGHFTGGLLSLVPQIHANSMYAELLRKVEDCVQ